MKRHLNCLYMLILVIGMFCSCGNSGKSQIDEQAIRDSLEKALKDSIAQVEAMKAKQDSIERVENSVPPFVDILSFFKKSRDGKPSWWKEVKNEMKAYMESRRQNLVFDGKYTWEDYTGSPMTYTALVYGKNIKFVPKDNGFKIVGSPFFGVIVQTLPGNPDTTYSLEILLENKADYEQYLKQVYSCFKKEEYVNGEGYYYEISKTDRLWLYHEYVEDISRGYYRILISPN